MTGHVVTGPVGTLLWQLRALGGYDDAVVLEHRFHPVRRWRFDMAWPDHRVAVEVDGGAFVGGRHVRGDGVRRDCEKVSEAAAAGWRIVRVLPEQVVNGQAAAWIVRALEYGRDNDVG